MGFITQIVRSAPLYEQISFPRCGLIEDVAGKKPRLIHVSIEPTGTAAFIVGTLRRRATDFTLHVELGGVAGVVASIIGKQPPDFHIWLQDSKPPAFIREEGALYEGGPVWRIEQLSPTLR